MFDNKSCSARSTCYRCGCWHGVTSVAYLLACLLTVHTGAQCLGVELLAGGMGIGGLEVASVACAANDKVHFELNIHPYEQSALPLLKIFSFILEWSI